MIYACFTIMSLLTDFQNEVLFIGISVEKVSVVA